MPTLVSIRGQNSFSYPRTPYDVTPLLHIFDELVVLTESAFGVKMRPLSVVNIPNHPDAPITYRRKNLIYVDCPNFHPPQFYYQFAHELCHYMIPKDVPEKLRWLEESIAVLATHYFSTRISSVSQDVLSQYIEKQFKKRTEINIADLKLPNSHTVEILESSPDFTDYRRYKSIALYLLPAVEANPLFWRAVPSLCSAVPAQDLAGSLNRWLGLISPSDLHDALANVVNTLL